MMVQTRETSRIADWVERKCSQQILAFLNTCSRERIDAGRSRLVVLSRFFSLFGQVRPRSIANRKIQPRHSSVSACSEPVPPYNSIFSCAKFDVQSARAVATQALEVM